MSSNETNNNVSVDGPSTSNSTFTRQQRKTYPYPINETPRNFASSKNKTDMDRGDKSSMARILPVSKPPSICFEFSDEATQTWAICPVSNSYAIMAITGVIIYSIIFLYYAQRQSWMLFIMTGFIAIFIVSLYTIGILSLFYLMVQINGIERKSDTAIFLSSIDSTPKSNTPFEEEDQTKEDVEKAKSWTTKKRPMPIEYEEETGFDMNKKMKKVVEMKF